MAHTPTTRKNALTIIRDLCKEVAPKYGLNAGGLDRESFNDALYLEWRRSFHVDCGLGVRLDDDRKTVTYNGEIYDLFTPTVKLNWPGTTRSLAASIAAAKLYSEVAELGALIQATLDELTIAEPQKTTGSAR